jgi:3-oxoacyl-[acyl-carrier-protein] synthase-3
MSVGILGTGSYVPNSVVTNFDLEKTVLTSDEWVFTKLGIHERHIADITQATSHLAVLAATKALQSANVHPSEIDVIILATATPDRPIPSTACRVQALLNARNAIAFDLSAVCSGFVYSLWLAHSLIQSRQARKVLVIGADTFSRITNWASRDCILFGDGAGAAILGEVDDGFGFLGFNLGTDGTGWENFTVPAGGSERPSSNETIEQNLHFFKHNGKEVFKQATTQLPKSITACLRECKLDAMDITWLVPHQPSIRILEETAKSLGYPFERVLRNMDRYANTAAATIPILLDEKVRSNVIRSEDIIMFAAMGAGWTWGTSIIRWGGRKEFNK